MLQLYKNIKLLRIANGWDQEYLAKKVGYADKSMISRIENGKVDLKQSQIMAFAEVFNISAGDLFGDTEDDFTTSSFEKELIEAYRLATESRQESVRVLLGIEKKIQNAESEDIDGSGSLTG